MKTQQHTQNWLIKQRKTWSSAAILLMFAPLVALTSQSLQAAELATDEAELLVEKIVVTGSRLKSGNQISKAPIKTIDEVSFALTGNFSGVAAINKLPQLMKSFGSVTRVSIKRDRWLIC